MGKKQILFGNSEKKTFEKLCEEYQRYGKINNLSPVTLKTYANACIYFQRFIGINTLCKNITQTTIDDYKLYLFDTGISAISVNSYIHNLSPTIKFGIKRGYIFKSIEFREIKAQEKIKDIYTTEELEILLKKPNIRKCGFAEYRNWAIINFLTATGVRATELRNIKIKDVDLQNDIIKLQVTKNNRARFVPISTSLKNVLVEYLPLRQYNSDDEYLFPNIYGEMIPRTTLQMGITKYCKRRGIEKYSLHLFRHCFATNYLRAGGQPIDTTKNFRA